uniref:Putative lipocalin-6 1 n=1 Tax=Amblyomma americanum TaxID=6943 RepID=A0A0C9R622_AMBAM
MAVFGRLLFCACILAAFAEQDGATSDRSTATSTVDGFKLLAQGKTYRLRETSFYFQDNNTRRCFTAYVSEKNDNNHEVTLELGYNSVTEDTWPRHKITFTFEHHSGGYNKMITSSGAAPSKNYIFLTDNPECILIAALDDEHHSPAAAVTEARHEQSEGTLRGNCMLWLEDEKETKPNEECYKKYNGTAHS